MREAMAAEAAAVAAASAIAVTADSSFVPVYAIRSHLDLGLIAGAGKPKARSPLGRLMVESGLLTRSELNDALALQRNLDGRALGWIVKTLGHCDDLLLGRLLAAQRGVPCVSLSGFQAAAGCRRLSGLVPHLAHCAVLLHEAPDEAWIAIADVTDPEPVRDVRRALGRGVQTVQAGAREIADFHFRRESRPGPESAGEDDREGG